ncbi:Thioredoxin-like protein 4B [Hordeum vulgare]|nr:Thioredoxin-like protein 4B [Hordeum vulgare]
MHVRRESLRQGASLEEMRHRLEQRRARADGLAIARRRAAGGVDRQKEQMQAQIERVLPLSTALAAAHRQVQVLDRFSLLSTRDRSECVGPARGERGEMGSVVLTTLRRKREVDAAIRDTLGKVLVLQFGRASHSVCLQLDDVLAKSSWDISKFARVALVDMDSEEIQVSHEHMSALLLDIIVDKHAIDIEPDYLKAIKNYDL